MPRAATRMCDRGAGKSAPLLLRLQEVVYNRIVCVYTTDTAGMLFTTSDKNFQKILKKVLDMGKV